MTRWPRWLEVALAVWLLAAPFALPRAANVWTDLACGALVLALAAASLRAPDRRPHLLTLLVAAWLAAAGWVGAPAPAAQNELVLALTLAMTAILPTRAVEPPREWLARPAG